MTGRRAPVGVQWRLTWAAALATFLATLVISPTIEAGDWLGASIIVIALVAVAGGLARQATLPRLVVTATTTITALVVVTFVAVHDEAVWGVIPGPAAWRAVADLVRDGIDVVWAQAPPVESTPGTTFLVVAGVAVVAVAVDALAVSWRRAGLAGIPLLTLYLVPASVLTEGVPWPLFAISAVGWLVLLLVESRDRLGRWGRTLAFGSGNPTTPVPLHIGGTGRRLGAFALVLAIGVPILLPAFSETILRNGHASDGDGEGPGASTVQRAVAINPIVNLKRDIRRGIDVELLRYQTTDPTPSYLRIATLDRFDGTSWLLADVAAPDSQQASDGLPSPPGLSDKIASTTIETDFEITALQDRRLPLPYPVSQVDVEGDWRWDAETFDVFSPAEGVSSLGQSYHAASLDLEPTAEQLTSAGPPSVELGPMLVVPSDVLPVLQARVFEVTKDATTDYEQALAIQTWFLDTFAYSLDTRSGNSATDLEAFLADRSGYCEQFAATMALMARVAGIPSRVQVGFTPGSQLSDGTWSVTAHDAHAWPELWFEGVGWVRFEPTPGGGDGGGAPGWAPPPASSIDPSGVGSGGPQQQAGPSHRIPGRQLAPLGEGRLERRGGFGTTGAAASTSVADTAKSLWWVGVLLVGGTAGVLLVAPAVERRNTRRRRRRAVGEAAVLEATWAETRDTMTDLELVVHSSDTLRDLQARLGRRGDFTAADTAAVNRLSTALEHSRYAQPVEPTSRPDVDATVWADADAVTAALLRSASPAARRRAIWWPASARHRLQLRWGGIGQWFERQFGRVMQGVRAPLRRLSRN